MSVYKLLHNLSSNLEYNRLDVGLGLDLLYLSWPYPFPFLFLSHWAPNLHNDHWRFFPFFLIAQIWFNRLVSDLATCWASNLHNNCWRSSPLVFLVLAYKTLSSTFFSSGFFSSSQLHLSSFVPLLFFYSSPQKFQLLIFGFKKRQIRLFFCFSYCTSNLKKLLYSNIGGLFNQESHLH